MKRAFAVCSFVFVFASVLAAQAPPVPKPAPEVKRLRYFVGTWNTEGDMKASPFAPAGKFTGLDRAEMMPGGFFLVTHSDGKGPMGVMKELAVMGYDTDEKVYTYNAFDNMGQHEVSKGTVQGDTWTWPTEEKMQGKVIKGRFIIKEVSPTSYTFKWDMADDKGGWSNVMDGKSTKAK